MNNENINYLARVSPTDRNPREFVQVLEYIQTNSVNELTQYKVTRTNFES